MPSTMPMPKPMLVSEEELLPPTDVTGEREGGEREPREPAPRSYCLLAAQNLTYLAANEVDAPGPGGAARPGASLRPMLRPRRHTRRR